MRVLIRDVFLSSPSFIILVFSTKIFFHVDRFYCSVPMVIPYFRDWLRIDPYISSKKRNNISCLVAYSVNTKSDCGMLVFQKMTCVSRNRDANQSIFLSSSTNYLFFHSMQSSSFLFVPEELSSCALPINRNRSAWRPSGE